jgi:glycogen synthase
VFSNVVTTVSPTYAQEVLRPEVRTGGSHTSCTLLILSIKQSLATPHMADTCLTYLRHSVVDSF